MAIKATRHKWVAWLYVLGVRFGARVLSLVRGGGDVALMVALLPCHAALLEHAPLSSYRSGAKSSERGS